MLNVEVLSDTHRILANPLRGGRVPHTLLHHGGYWLRIRKLTLVFFFGQVFSDEAPLRIRSTRVLDGWVHVDRKRIANPANLNVLVKAIVVAILGKQSDIPFAVRHLVLTRRVIRHIRIRDVLYMAYKPVKYFRYFNIGLVVHGNYLPTWSVLALIVGNLSDVLGKFVNGQAGSGVDCLPLHRTTGSQHIGWPLPLVVRTCRIKA